MAIPWPADERARSVTVAVQALLLPLRLALIFHRPDAPIGAASDTAGESTEGSDDFDRFFQRHQQDVFGYLWRLTGEEQAAYDLSQETFLRAWQRFETIRDYDRPGAWLIRVATNLALKHLRHRGVVGRVTAALGRTGASAPGDHATQIAEDDMLRRVLLDIAPRPRAVLVLHDVYGLTSEEIADTLGMTRAAVRMMLCRAREQFRIRYMRQEAQ
jgi:RNA polymerase sigma-70 factor (ECF subfamily)